MISIYTQLQFSSASSVYVQAGEPILFNKIVAQSSGIFSNLSTGGIRLDTAGVYLVEWDLSYNSISTMPIVFSVEADNGTSVEVASIVTHGQANGSAIITAAGVTNIYLHNNQNSDTILLLQNEVSANMTVFRIADINGNIGSDSGDDDGNGGGISGGSKIVIPFTGGKTSPAYPEIDANGYLQNIGLISNGSSTRLPVITNALGEQLFTVPFGSDNVQQFFTLPYDAKLVSCSAIFNNLSSFYMSTQDVNICPFVAIATPAAGTYNFQIIADSKTSPERGYQFMMTPIPNSTILNAVKKDMDIIVPAGTPMAIVVGFVSKGAASQYVAQYIYTHGSLAFELE